MTTKKKARAAAVPMPRGTSKQQTREALIVAALELFGEEGLAAPSLDAICLRAGYTRGAFYVHFPDRDALVVAVMESLGQEFLKTVFEPLAAGAGEPRGESGSALAEASRRFVELVQTGAYPLMSPPDRSSESRRPQVRPHQLLEACSRSTIVRERYKFLVEACVEHVAALTRADQTTGTVRGGVDPTETGVLFVAAVIGVQTLAELGVAADPGKISDLLINVFSRSA